MDLVYQRTSISVSRATRDRVSACAKSQAASIEEFLTRLLDEHEERVFWERSAATRHERLPDDVGQGYLDAIDETAEQEVERYVQAVAQ